MILKFFFALPLVISKFSFPQPSVIWLQMGSQLTYLTFILAFSFLAIGHDDNDDDDDGDGGDGGDDDDDGSYFAIGQVNRPPNDQEIFQ